MFNNTTVMSGLVFVAIILLVVLIVKISGTGSNQMEDIPVVGENKMTLSEKLQEELGDETASADATEDIADGINEIDSELSDIKQMLGGE